MNDFTITFLTQRIKELENLKERGIRKVSLPMDGKTFLIDDALKVFKEILKK